MMDHYTDERPTGPSRGDFVAPSDADDHDERTDALPAQDQFWRPPVRFGSVPVEKEPLGWDRRRGFRKHFPYVKLPFQVVERVQFGHSNLVPNRLFWGDNLHVMRQLRNETIDLIYIDPPFFSGKHYNVIFGDQNELRSFSDIWQGGMPGYLIWLNSRLYEMKRLLKRNGSIYVHCDWHASHYIKVEMDKIFGYDNFRNEVIWHYGLGAFRATQHYPRKHDALLFYSKSLQDATFNVQRLEPTDAMLKKYSHIDENGNRYMISYGKRYYLKGGKPADTVWDVPAIAPNSGERIGYPTQKPETLLERIIKASTNENDIVADFFGGGGTTAAVAQRLRRRWITCDQSRVAVAITAGRLTRQVEEQTGKLFAVPDFTVEHWGVYEARRLAAAPPHQFRAFVLSCFGARDEDQEDGIHGYKGAIPVWVGDPDQSTSITQDDVQTFANSIRKTLRYQQDNLRDGFMLAWAFRTDATEAANRLRQLEQTDLNFIRMDMIRIDSPRFRTHVATLSTEHADYENFLTFVQPPRVEVGFRRVAARKYTFDASETIVMNAGAKIINVQWDFDYDGRFSSTPGYSFIGGQKDFALQATLDFLADGRQHIACKVQDDMGGEGLWIGEIEVT